METQEEFEQIVEKIVFDEDELEELKVVIRTFSEGKTTPKQFKQKLLQCRERMVGDLTEFVYLFIKKSHVNDAKSVSSPINSEVLKLQEELTDKNELLEIVASKLNQTIIKLKN